jgi:hypothetical protein
MSFVPKNNYNSFTQEFKKDTGLEPKDHPAEYIAYYNARMTDELNQTVRYIAGQLVSGEFSSNLSTQIANAIRHVNKFGS